MYDPMTLAFELCRPPLDFWRKGYWGRLTRSYWPDLIAIWHVDPETDGSDDSCGWSYPRLTDRQRDILKHTVWMEARYPWFRRDPVKEISSAADAESLMRGLILDVIHSLHLGRKFTWEEVCELACRLVHNPHDNFRGDLCFLPGWHVNSQQDTICDREYVMHGMLCNLARVLLRKKRPWYKHPRWHVWHWKVSVTPFLHLKRWLFTRCCKCGKRFRYGEAPTTYNWVTQGPRWFKSEEGVFHINCEGDSCDQANSQIHVKEEL